MAKKTKAQRAPEPKPTPVDRPQPVAAPESISEAVEHEIQDSIVRGVMSDAKLACTTCGNPIAPSEVCPVDGTVANAS